MSLLLKLNGVLFLIWTAAFVSRLPLDMTNPHMLFSEVLILVGLFAMQIALQFRIRALYGFMMVLLYTMALFAGMRLMLSFDRLFTLAGAFGFLFDVFLIIYFFGVRGFLKSDKGRSAMNLEINS